MLFSPKEAIEKGWVKGLVDPEKQVQPNAIDFTLDHLYGVNDAPFIISENCKEMRNGNKLEPYHSFEQDPSTGFWKIDGMEITDGMSDIYVDLPEGIACGLIVRSTLNRNGLFITSGLYDSGFKGNIGFMLHNRSQAPAYIAPGTRVGQIYFMSSDSVGVYAGGYNTEEGKHWGDNYGK